MQYCKGFKDITHTFNILSCTFLSLQYSNVLNDRHFTCEDCDGTVSGGFDAASSQVRNQLLTRDEQLLVASKPFSLINELINICLSF